MYEGWHVELTDHARSRMDERAIDEDDILKVIYAPDDVRPNEVYGGRLLSRYLADWGRILVVAIQEIAPASIILVKTALWSKES